MTNGSASVIDESGAATAADASVPEAAVQRPTLLNRISTRLYSGVAGAVALTLAASIVGLISFQRIDQSQRDLYNSSIVQIEAAFAITEQTGRLVAAAARLASSQPDNYEEVAREVDETKRDFQDQLDNLESLVVDEEQAQRLRIARGYANILVVNISTISADLPRYHRINDELTSLKSDLDRVVLDLKRLADTAIEDQLFYMLTGFRELPLATGPPTSQLTEAGLSYYLDLRSVRTDLERTHNLLLGPYIATSSDEIEPLNESFEFAIERLQISSRSLPESDLATQMHHAVARLTPFYQGDANIFDAAKTRLTILERRAESLSQNLAAEQNLVSEVAAYAVSAQQAADAQAQATSKAIRTGQILLVIISAVGVLGALAISWLYIGRLLLRRVSVLSNRMRALAAGDLETEIQLSGRDEVADMAAALEVFRQDALEVQRLNLVEQLANELGEKNEELEIAMANLGNAQNQIVAREKLAALGELTAGVAHEIRNPLNFIKNFSESSEELLEEMFEVLEDHTDKIDDDDQDYISEISDDLTQNLKRIRAHGERANRIVEDMLKMGRGAGGTQSTEINSLVRDHAMLAYHSARAADPDYVVSIEEDYDPEMGDLHIVSQDVGRVIVNLVSNAGYATRDRQTELLTNSPDSEYVPTVRITTLREAGYATIKIWDNGTGIDPDEVSKIFEPFFTTKPPDQGTGLGLAMSNDIIRSHGGEILVDSQVGEFTEFTVTLPTYKPSPLG